MRNIEIHWDYSNSKEISFYDGVLSKKSFQTHCLMFFGFDNLVDDNDIIVKKKNGDYISARELLDNDGSYTNKSIRPAHNILRILMADGFKWKSLLE